MTTNKIRKINIIWYVLVCFALCIVSCTKIVDSNGCYAYTNKDSLIECVLTYYDTEACDALDLCHNDTNSVLYSILVADSSDAVGFYDVMSSAEGIERMGHSCGLSDTAKLFYYVKSIIMGVFPCFDSCRNNAINFPDSIYNVLYEAYHHYYGSYKYKEKFVKEYNNLDSLYNVVLSNSDVESYKKLRYLLYNNDSILPVSIEIANKTHYPLACYDVYYDIISRRRRVPNDEFQFAYQYLCEAVDSMYYPAVFLKASLCLTGAYFPPDTTLGKRLLEQCHGCTSIPFWQQYYKPEVYRHLLKTKRKMLNS